MTNKTLSLSANKEGAKAPSTRGKAKKPKKNYGAALAEAGDNRKDKGKVNPPKYIDATNQNLAGKDIAKYFRVTESKNLSLTDFSGSDLRGSKFRGLIIQGCIFKGALIDEETDFAGSDARWSNFHGVQWPEGGKEYVKWGDMDDDGILTNRANTFECDGVTR